VNKLLPDRLKDLWQAVTQKQLTEEEFSRRQEDWLAEYRDIWKQALLLDGHAELQESLLAELGRYVGSSDLAAIRQRCQRAVDTVKGEWPEEAGAGDRQAIEQFYDKSQDMMYELMWWHTLGEDVSPLGYVTALQFARQKGCRNHLDFGAGVGAGGILFARHGLTVTLADISTPLQRFSRWRMELRQLPAQYLDLKVSQFPSNAFDIVTAMDVFEHLVDPVRTVEELWEAMKPGGYLFARLYAEVDEQRPQHIVQDFGPTFQRLHELGFVEVWRDEWLWGHQVFQKT
jgi:SAM-dependent methyltransferase